MSVSAVVISQGQIVLHSGQPPSPRQQQAVEIAECERWARWAELIAGFLPLLHAAHS